MNGPKIIITILGRVFFLTAHPRSIERGEEEEEEEEDVMDWRGVKSLQ